MKAGQALGLLAGLGAINALRGGRDGAGPRFTGLLDMIDGGGAGQSGDKFEGGGLLSILGNLFAKPYEAQDRVEQIARDTGATNALTRVLEQAAKDQRNLDKVDAYNRAQADAGAQAALMSDIYDGTILPAGSGGLLSRAGEVPTTVDESASGFDYVSDQGKAAPALKSASTLPAPNIDVGFDDFPAATNESYVAPPSLDAARQRALQLYGPRFNDLLPQTQEQIIARMQAIMQQR